MTSVVATHGFRWFHSKLILQLLDRTYVCLVVGLVVLLARDVVAANKHKAFQHAGNIQITRA